MLIMTVGIVRHVTKLQLNGGIDSSMDCLPVASSVYETKFSTIIIVSLQSALKDKTIAVYCFLISCLVTKL